MKKIVVFLALLCALYYFCVQFDSAWYRDLPINKNHAASLPAKASHMLGIMDSAEDDEPLGHCTGTVIGPHAILTAEHCNRGKALQLDFSLHTFRITKTLKDGRDHIIFLVDGPAFHDIEPYDVRPPVAGEYVYLFGFGGKQYPAAMKHGYSLDEYDPSEVDRANGLSYFSIPTIRGDSGSAIYGSDGKIVGVVTYGITADLLIAEQDHSGSFVPTFTPEQIALALTYVVPEAPCASALDDADTPERFNSRNPLSH